MHDVGIRTGGHQARAKGGFEHVRTATGVFADYDFCFFAQPGAVVPAQETADLHRMIKGQVFVGFAAEAVCTEIFTHCYISSLWMISPLSSLWMISPLFFQMESAGTTPLTQEVG